MMYMYICIERERVTQLSLPSCGHNVQEARNGTMTSHKIPNSKTENFLTRTNMFANCSSCYNISETHQAWDIQLAIRLFKTRISYRQTKNQKHKAKILISIPNSRKTPL